MSRLSSLRQLYLTRLREFYRQPARIFWVYGFPTILAIVLGLAFKNQKPQPVTIESGPRSSIPLEDVKLGKDRQGDIYPRPSTSRTSTESSPPSAKPPPPRASAGVRRSIVTPRPFDQAIDNLKTGKSVLVLEVTPLPRASNTTTTPPAPNPSPPGSPSMTLCNGPPAAPTPSPSPMPTSRSPAPATSTSSSPASSP